MTTVLTTDSGVRLRSAPTYDPPLEGGSGQGWMPPAQPTLPLSTLAGPPPQETSTPPVPDDTDPATRAAAQRFVRTCLEILNGYRPVTHVRSLAYPLAAASVLQAMTFATRRLARATAGTSPRAPVHLRRLRVCQPRPGVAEISAVVGTDQRARGGVRCWGAAFRLEHHRGRWWCTVARLI